MATAITAIVIMSTILTKKNKNPSSALFLCCAIVSFLLFLLSAHSFVARLILLSGDASREAIFESDNASNDDLIRLMVTRESVVSWYSNNAVLNDLALAYLEKARRTGVFRPEAANDINMAIDRQLMALSKSPADAYGWSRLSYMLLIVDGPSKRAAKALAHAMQTAPYEPRLMLTRLNTAMLLFPYLDNDVKDKLPRLVQDAWDLDKKGVINAAKIGRYSAYVRNVIGSDYEEDFE